MRKNNGFTLIEILVVIAVLIVTAAGGVVVWERKVQSTPVPTPTPVVTISPFELPHATKKPIQPTSTPIVGCFPDGTEYTTEYGFNECERCCSKTCYQLPRGCSEQSGCTLSHKCGKEPGLVELKDIDQCAKLANRQDCYWETIYNAMYPRECQYKGAEAKCTQMRQETAEILLENNYCQVVETMATGVNDDCYYFIGKHFPSREICNKINSKIKRDACLALIKE